MSWNFQDYISYDGWIEGFDTTLSSSADKIRVVSASENYIVLNGQAVFVKENDFWKIDEIKNKPR